VCLERKKESKKERKKKKRRKKEKGRACASAFCFLREV